MRVCADGTRKCSRADHAARSPLLPEDTLEVFLASKVAELGERRQQAERRQVPDKGAAMPGECEGRAGKRARARCPKPL